MDDGLTTQRLFERIARDHPGTLPLADLLDAFSERAFGLFLLLAILPAFLPLPAGAGAISGPLVSLAGLNCWPRPSTRGCRAGSNGGRCPRLRWTASVCGWRDLWPGWNT
jgi:hypothetical protein